MTRFHSSCPELAVHSNLLLKRKLPEECEQHALRDAAPNMTVGIGYGRHVGTHLPVRKSTGQLGAGGHGSEKRREIRALLPRASWVAI